MKIQKLFYRPGTGWSVPSFPQWDSPGTLVLLFGPSDLLNHPGPIEDLTRFYPQAQFLGCSSAGEIFGNQVFDGTLSAAVVAFEHTELRVSSVPINEGAESHEVGKILAENLNRPGLRGIIILSDGLHVNGSALVKGVNSVLSPGVVVTGGLAGDGFNFKGTWVLHNRRPVSKTVSALGLYGDRIRINHGSQGGWDIFGPERLVTKSKNNILYELDGRPALQLYKEYLGEKAKELPASALLFPLQIRVDNRTDKRPDKRLVRTILSVDEQEQGMVFAGDIPQGSYAQLMRANFDRLIEGAASAAGQAAGSTPSKGGPLLALAISCVGRKLVLGERIEEEVEATLERLPTSVEQIGFYSYGELSPHEAGDACELHNQTMTMTTLSED